MINQRQFSEQLNNNVLFRGSQKEDVIGNAVKKLRVMSAKSPLQRIYILINNRGMSLLLGSPNKSRTLNIVIDRSHFSQFQLTPGYTNYSTFDGIASLVCCIDFSHMQLLFRRNDIIPAIILTDTDLLLYHHFPDETITQIAVLQNITDMKEVPVLPNLFDVPLSVCVPISSLQPIKTLDSLGSFKHIEVTSTSGKESKLIFTRNDDMAQARVLLKGEHHQLPSKQAYSWSDILFLIALTRTSDKTDLTLRFRNNLLQATTTVAGADYHLVIAKAQ